LLDSSEILAAQDAAQKTRDLVAALDKTKYKKKEKANVSIEVFVDVKNEAVVRPNRSEYSGRYESDGYQLMLTVGENGSASGSGFDSSAGNDKVLKFSLKDGRVDGALLSGTKVYEDGSERPFEVVFVNRTSRVGTNPNVAKSEPTMFGIGFIQYENGNSNSGWTNRVFLEKL
jgi:hypothetical protein